MNFQTIYERGKLGLNKGLPTGLESLDRAIKGIQKGKIYGVAAGAKV